MNLSLLILLTGGFLTILSQTIQLTYKYKNDHLKTPEPPNKADPIDTSTKNAYISNYCIANGLDRMDWIDQKIYKNKYYEIDILCYSIDQLYTVAKYGKWENLTCLFFCLNCQTIQIVWIVHTIRIFKLFELSEYSNCFNYENNSYFWHNSIMRIVLIFDTITFQNNCSRNHQAKNFFHFIIVSKNKTIQNI